MYRKYIVTIVILKITFRIFYFDNIQVTNSLLFFHGYQNNLLDITARNSLNVTASSTKKPRLAAYFIVENCIILSRRFIFHRLISLDEKKEKTMNIKTVSSYTRFTAKGGLLLAQSN